MGMDQTLQARCYIKDHWQHKQITEAVKIPPQFHAHSGLYVEVTVGHWRNAGMIHDWFANKIMGGLEETGTFYVDRETIEDLQKDCSTVLQALSNNDENVAKQLIPNNGWWFVEGYGDPYREEIEATLRVVTECLEFGDEWDFEYSANY